MFKNTTGSGALGQALSTGQYLLTFHVQLHSAMLADLGFFLNYQIMELLVMKQHKTH